MRRTSNRKEKILHVKECFGIAKFLISMIGCHLVLSLTLSLPFLTFSIYSLIYNSVLSPLLFSFSSLACIHIHTAINTRALF